MLTQYKPLTITQLYSDTHKAIDIRNYNGMYIYAPETIKIIRNSVQNGVDKYGNHYIVAVGLDTGHFLRFIHNEPFVLNDDSIPKGFIIGKTIIGGNALQAHLHFVTSKKEYDEFFNPEEYLQQLTIRYTYKKGLTNAS